ncbi:MAG: ATP-binding cassette domain-containing protein [Nitrospira sp.]|nr:ATP-binding cassette domain-containing protein [bacterium]MBL7050148.1 ATP-binding cassette domain-containing protein [Nitrospira sp.]
MIHIENLTKFYNDICAVDKISFDIRKGEILGLLGPNGAGKTTTMRMLTCYLRPSSGSITVKDFNIEDNPVEIKKLIGYLPESAPIYPDMLVYDYLKFVADIRGIDRALQDGRIKELAGICALNAVMHKSVGELSKGYKQRVGLAHAMIDDPEILVLDEPTSGLDPNQIVEIRDIIKKIGKEKTVILSTHILSEAEATCDRIVIINNGLIAADGSTEDLKRQAGSDYIINVSLLNAVFEEAKEALQSITGVSEVILAGSENNQIDLHIACRSTNDLRQDIFKLIKEKDWGLLEFNRETKSLENIFRELTR